MKLAYNQKKTCIFLYIKNVHITFSFFCVTIKYLKYKPQIGLLMYQILCLSITY
jgi:hypothetical protein